MIEENLNISMEVLMISHDDGNTTHLNRSLCGTKKLLDLSESYNLCFCNAIIGHLHKCVCAHFFRCSPTCQQIRTFDRAPHNGLLLVVV